MNARPGLYAGVGAGFQSARKTLGAARLGQLSGALAAAFETELAERRLFLWLPVAAGAGVVLYFLAAREPSVSMVALLTVATGALSWAGRQKRAIFYAAIAACALFCGMLSAQLRLARVAAPVLDRIRIVELTGFVEEMDLRHRGARFLLRVASADGLDPSQIPYRVRLTTRNTPAVKAGDFIALKARLLPPSRASLPGGYDFARDAYFARIGGVGSVLGRMESLTPPDPPDFMLSVMAAIDHGRNALAARIADVMDEQAGAIAVAMVTGKRDLLSDATKDLIREAGIFHIITISGIQMTLVAGIFFFGLRRMLALSSTLALNYPIKKWAAAAAMVGAIFYDIVTGSRVGTERALFMTLIVFAAVLCDRQALTMRNLAFAALVVIALEPEAILGVSFQLSFAAVAALVAVYEARMRAGARQQVKPAFRKPSPPPGQGAAMWEWARAKLAHGLGATLFATLCATSATASFMAYHFHELSPYVLIGNPLTLVIIEIFAVPGALLGAALYPLGLDEPVWHYVGLGIDLVIWAARKIAAAPGATLHVPQFAPWAIVFLALAVLSCVVWRTRLLRATAIPFLIIGVVGGLTGERFDLAVPSGGDSVAVRGPDGRLSIVGRHPNGFASEQWLRAAGDGRGIIAARADAERCDVLGCTALMADGRAVSLVMRPEAFEEDCRRAALIVTPLFAPHGCAAGLVLDRRMLAQTGAVTLIVENGEFRLHAARAKGEDRPWSPQPKYRSDFRKADAKKSSRPANTVEEIGEETPQAPWL